MRIIITQNASEEMVNMIRRSYHRASGNSGFANPDIIVE